MHYYQQFHGGLYIGQNIGEEILSDMQQAKHSIKIISPYITKKQLRILNGVKANICIITNSGNNIDNILINEICIKNDKNFRRYKKYNIWAKIIGSIGICGTILLSILILIEKDLWFLFSAILFAILTERITNKLRRIRNQIQVYFYEYTKTLDFVYADPGEYGIHSKIYIIDERVAYVCSGNFTNNGMIYNFETSVRTEDTEAIRMLNEKFEKHKKYLASMQDWTIKEVGLKVYGKRKKYNDSIYINFYV